MRYLKYLKIYSSLAYNKNFTIDIFKIILCHEVTKQFLYSVSKHPNLNLEWLKCHPNCPLGL